MMCCELTDGRGLYRRSFQYVVSWVSVTWSYNIISFLQNVNSNNAIDISTHWMKNSDWYMWVWICSPELAFCHWTRFSQLYLLSFDYFISNDAFADYENGSKFSFYCNNDNVRWKTELCLGCFYTNAYIMSIECEAILLHVWQNRELRFPVSNLA